MRVGNRPEITDTQRHLPVCGLSDLLRLSPLLSAVPAKFSLQRLNYRSFAITSIWFLSFELLKPVLVTALVTGNLLLVPRLLSEVLRPFPLYFVDLLSVQDR